MEKHIQLEWILGDKHPFYGEVVMMGNIGGESIRWFFKDGVTSMIPLDLLTCKERDLTYTIWREMNAS